MHDGCVMRKYIHTAVGKGNCVCVAGHTLLLTIVGAGGRSHSITSVDIVWVDGLPTWCMPGKEEIQEMLMGGKNIYIYQNRP